MFDTPIYHYKASVQDINGNKSKLKGKIYFEIYEDGMSVIGEISNFPKGYTEIQQFGLNAKSNNYQELAEEMLKEMNSYLAELTDENEVVGGFGTLVLTPIEDSPFTDYKFIGKVVDMSTKEPIGGASITDSENNWSTVSEENGDFELIGQCKVLPPELVELALSSSKNEALEEKLKNPNFKLVSPFTLTVAAQDYESVPVIPVTLEGELKSTLGITPLIPSEIVLKQAIEMEIPLTIPQVRTLQLSKMDFEQAKQQAINRVIVQLKTVLLPQILALIAAFGVAAASKAIGKKYGDMNATCPASLDELNELIRKKNRLTKILNNIYNFLKGLRVGVQVVDGLITLAQVLLPVLTSLSSAPGGNASPTEAIKRELKKYKFISSATLILLTLLVEILNRVIEYLKTLDSLIEGCSIEGALPQETLTDDLLAATQTSQSPVITNVNGFIMSVIPVEGPTNSSLKRRKAIARNQAGVIMLEGEPSFSSNDQILIDELVYYIQTNDLKAD